LQTTASQDLELQAPGRQELLALGLRLIERRLLEIASGQRRRSGSPRTGLHPCRLSASSSPAVRESQNVIP
jgi:hypothetical protein